MGNESRLRVEELEREGWVKQFTASEPRLSEAVALYLEAGFEVHLEPLEEESACDTCESAEHRGEQGECRVCFQGFEGQYKIIFTRRREDSKPFGDKL
ncbi:MAG: hypothetical protein ACM335_06955 [Deltaproteobacteria bacterium]